MLREVWMNIGVEKLDTHEGITVKALLDSGATGMFMDKRMAARHGFKLQKLERPIVVRNVNKQWRSDHPSGKSKCLLQRSCRKNENRCMQPGKNRNNLGNTMVGGTQSRDKLGNRKGQNDEMSALV